jgi:hypothetical protein
VEVTVEGLQPGDVPTLIYTRLHNQDTAVITYGPAQSSVDENGRFTMQDDLYPPSPDQTTEWQLQFVHARGVACLQFTLPDETSFQVARATATPAPLTDLPPPQPTQSPWSSSWNNMPVLSADGRAIAFVSNGRLTADAIDEAYASYMRGYLFDRETGQIERINMPVIEGVIE